MKRMLEDYACIFHSLNELPYCKGLIDYLNDPEAGYNAVLHLLRKSLETEKKKEQGLIVNPYG
ncbi:MAG: hypothetical protein EHM12_12920 [Dehalococcoidia bacterium]|nr:MAG: hypothetical protein EHM12_12920 [Dehalococcoidia bacterium]